MNKLQSEFNQRRQGNVEPGSREKRQLLGLRHGRSDQLRKTLLKFFKVEFIQTNIYQPN